MNLTKYFLANLVNQTSSFQLIRLIRWNDPSRKFYPRSIDRMEAFQIDRLKSVTANLIRFYASFTEY